MPLSIYRKIRYYFKDKYKNDFKKISKLIKNGDIYKSFNDTMINYMYYCHEDGEVKDIILWSKNADLLLSQKVHKKSDTISLTYKKKDKPQSKHLDYSYLDRYIPNHSNSFNGHIIMPTKLSNYQLLNYYYNLLNTNHENINIDHFNVVKNEMITRKILNEELKLLTSSNDDYIEVIEAFEYEGRTINQKVLRPCKF